MRKFLFLITIAFVLSFTSQTLAQTQPAASGHWEGALDVQGNSIEIIVDLTAGANGSWNGAISMPSQNLQGFPLSNLKVEGANVSFEMAGAPGVPAFKGKLSADGKTITGEFSQSGATLPFKLERKGDSKLSSSAGPSIKASDELVGNWQGTLDVSGTVLHLTLKIAKAADGSFKASLDSPDQNNIDLPVSSLTAAGDSLSFDLKYLGGSFQGTINKARTEIAGTWTQGGSIPLTLKREAKK